MNNHKKLFVRLLVLTVVLVTVTSYAGVMSAMEEDRNVLWEIISHCLDASKPHYSKDCKRPITGLDSSCLNTTKVWAKSNDYVAIRDRKMCGCPGDFVHGLASPLQKVTGVEANNRPVGIWDFAWDVAKKRIPESEIALVVNPKTCRGQDQLHVHIVKLNDKGHKIIKSNIAARVKTLDLVWNKADVLARKAKLENYGILVKHDETGYLVLVDERCSEKIYTEYKCDK